MRRREDRSVPVHSDELKDEDRIAIAQTIIEHLKLCRWEFSKPSDPSFEG